ncbi:hypothetical protein OG785_09995 [Streptomyces sp. NBC_00006]|uniref:hypothetical protein n=1 Tax=unclassified Streptomyces TaxID=2593676 RepID=UPI00225324A6|nr:MULTISPECIES: hypothetical protein [unclassified Streptomyces]MCX5530889.1 hypothetical protein [Streptomyces sp. NBC_00006]
MHGAAADETQEAQLAPQLPLTKCAFDDPGTRTAWTKSRRKVRVRLTLWTVFWVGSFVALSLLDGFGVIGLSDVRFKGRRGGSGGNLLGMVGAVVFLVYLCQLYLYVVSLRSLKRMRRVLERHPWRIVSAVRKQHQVTDPSGVPVRLRIGAEGARNEWSHLMSASGVPRKRRWPEAMEHGAWHAGDNWGPGVLALPGGEDLMEVRKRQAARTARA